jgi:hypothetical protein
MSAPNATSGPTADGSLAAAARAVGRAVGFLRRISFGSVTSRSRPRRALDEPERGKKRLASSKRDEALRSEISKLEAALDGVYDSLVTGASSEIRPSSADLDKLVQRARVLRNKLNEKRAQLDRAARAEARERRLRPAPQAASQPAADRSRKREREEPPRRSHAIPAVRAATIRRELEQLPSERSSDELIFERLARSLTDEEAEVRRAAVSQLADLDGAPVGRLLAMLVDDPSEKVRVAALNALGRRGDGEHAAMFKRLCGDPNHNLRLASLRGLAKTDDPEANHQLVEALEDDHAGIRKTCAMLLGWREATEAVRPLILALRDPDELVRAEAAVSLGNLHDERAVLPLARALVDPTLPVREAALGSLRLLTGEPLQLDVNDPTASGYAEEVDRLKAWWRQARVDRHVHDLDLELPPPPVTPERMHRRRTTAPEPEPRPGTGAEKEAAASGDYVVPSETREVPAGGGDGGEPIPDAPPPVQAATSAGGAGRPGSATERSAEPPHSDVPEARIGAASVSKGSNVDSPLDAALGSEREEPVTGEESSPLDAALGGELGEVGEEEASPLDAAFGGEEEASPLDAALGGELGDVGEEEASPLDAALGSEEEASPLDAAFDTDEGEEAEHQS